MPSLLSVLSAVPAILAAAGIGQALAGWRSVRRFRATPGLPRSDQPPITLLKPLYGDEPLLEHALASVCSQDYPNFQVVFGVQDRADPAIPVVRRLQMRFPDTPIDLVIDPALHGRNRKISNLINMLPMARHDILLIADSDLHCAPDYLSRVAAEFAAPSVGLVTTLYAGLAANGSLAARLGASAINHGFVPGALMSRDLAREDCLGATMALHRSTLAAIGGLQALVDHLADDNVLGQLVRARSLRIRMAATVPATTVPETSLGALFSHELRWSRTILSLVPVQFALSSIQFPLFWAALALVLSGGAWWAATIFVASWIVRGTVAVAIDRSLGLVAQGRATRAPVWLLPVRDLLSMAVLLASYVSDKVEWRGQMMHTRPSEAPDTARHEASVSQPQGTVLS